MKKKFWVGLKFVFFICLVKCFKVWGFVKNLFEIEIDYFFFVLFVYWIIDNFNKI